MSIGIVCEGKCDFEIISWCLRPALVQKNIEPRFVSIQPSRDMTSGTFSEGGWMQVFQWCVRNDAAARRRYFGSGLFAGDEDGVDCILVHVDGDLPSVLSATDYGADVCSIPVAGVGTDVASRLQFCVELVESWLARGSDRTAADIVHATPTVHESEAWLLGGLKWHADPEGVPDPKTEFARQVHQRNNRPVPADLGPFRRNFKHVKQAIALGSADVDGLKLKSQAFSRALALFD